MANDTLIHIAVTTFRPACADEPDLEERLRKAFLSAHGFWLTTDNDVRFKGGVIAAMLETSDEAERKRIELSLAGLAAVSAAFSGVPVDMERALTFPEGVEPIPLLKLWEETKP